MPDQTQGFSLARPNDAPDPTRRSQTMRIPRPQLNYANVIATIALFVALGGAAIAAGLPKNSVGPKQLKRGAVTAPDIRRGAVTAGKIAPKAVVAGKLGANAVLPGNLGAGIITTSKLSDGAVIASKIKNGVVTTNKLDNEAVTTAKLGKESVTLGKLADDVAPLLGTLKSGQTLRGVFDVGGGGIKTEANDEAHGAISYQFPLLSTPAASVMQIGQSTPGCPGLSNSQTPLADPGHLCIYIAGWSNIEPGSEPLTTENDTRLGAGLVLKAREAGFAFAAYGLWAVTAP
jgi:hypothetical protein